MQGLDNFVRQSFQHLLEREYRLGTFRSKYQQKQLENSSKSLNTPQTLQITRGEELSNPSLNRNLQETADRAITSQTYDTSSLGRPQSPLRLVAHSTAPCTLDCSCSCHRYSQSQTPKCLSRVIGSLFLGYRAAPWCKQFCTDPFCRARTTRVSYTYTFPKWLLNRVLHASMVSSRAGGPEFILRVMRVRDNTAAPFQRLWTATTQRITETTVMEIKSMIDNGEASILDTNPGGHTLLSVRQALGFCTDRQLARGGRWGFELT